MTVPYGNSLAALIRSDLDRYRQSYRLRHQPFAFGKVAFESVVFKAGFQAALLYRVSHALFRKGRIYGAWSVSRLNTAITGAEIEFNAHIGPGMLIAHPVGLVVGRGTVIGSRVTLFQGVTFGARSWHPDDIRCFPSVGNGCYFFTHATIVGGIEIGDECVVGAQSLVTSNLPAGALARGVPAEVVPEKGRQLIESWGGVIGPQEH